MLFSLSLLTAAIFCAAKVEINVQMDWPLCADNLLLSQVGEFVAYTYPQQYFAIIDLLSEGDGWEEVAGKLRAFNVDIELAKRSVGMGFFAARIEAVRSSQEARCDPAIEWEGGSDCTSNLSKTGKSSKIKLTRFDHVYGSEDAQFLIVGSIGKKSTKELIRKAQEGGRPFAFRPYVATCQGSKVTVDNSFGVRFEVHEVADIRQGAERYIRSEKESLGHLQLEGKQLHDTKDDDQMTLRSIQAVISSKQPFEALKHISHNYPLLRAAIAQVTPSEALKRSIRKLAQRVPPFSPPIVYINGLEAQSEFIDAYSLTRLAMLLERQGIAQEQLQQIIGSWFDRKTPLFNIPFADKSLTIINDLESDKRYSEWSRQIDDIFRPSRSPFRLVAKNLVSCIAIIDMSPPSNPMSILDNILELVEENLPVRFAVVFNGLSADTLSQYYGLLYNLNLKEAINFIKAVAAKKNLETYARENPRIKSIKFLKECSRHKDAQAAAARHQILAKEFDLGQQTGHYAIINGRPTKLVDEDPFENTMSIVRAYQEEMADIRASIRAGLLSGKESDMHMAILEKRKDMLLSRSHSKYAPLTLDPPASRRWLADRANLWTENTLLVPEGAADTAKGRGYLKALGEGTEVKHHSHARHAYYYVSMGRAVELEDQLTLEDLELARRYDRILTDHLAGGKPPKGRLRLAQQELLQDMSSDLRALFPTLQPLPQLLTSLLSGAEAITFGAASAPIKVTAVVNPLAPFTQRLLSLLDDFGPDRIHATIYLNGALQGPEQTHQSLYRWYPRVDVPNGRYDVQLDCPENWAVSAATASTDLSSFEGSGSMSAVYRLRGLVVEGNAVNVETRGAATGAAIRLSRTDSQKVEDESTVMGNFGYYQVTAKTPGHYSILNKAILIDRLDSVLLDRLKVEKIEKIEAGPSEDCINIFSIATGASYEQLIRIMMLSAVKSTKNRQLCFWLIDSLVSPQLRRSLSVLSEKYSFSVKYVHYKWPSWLFKPASRRLAVWASKVLFLDVLFKQSMKRVLFVDADQVIRGDLKELWDTDLQGRVIGMTSFCDSRKEAEGYRFWKSGYWKDYLQGRPYFISAMFLVDLERFRRDGVGDLLRGQYQLLSRDPNSLSNLDQDLLNHVQRQVPIHQLPKEWLWCESWCSDEEKGAAKIIDLCNNPATKETKLEAAKRIIPEWGSLNANVLKALNSADDVVSHNEL